MKNLTISAKTRRTFAAVIGLTATAVSAAAIGYAAGEEEVKTRTVTETVEKNVTPDECAAALDHAEELMTLLADSLEVAGDLVVAAGEWDLAEMEKGNAALSANGDLVDGLVEAYVAAATACDGEPRDESGGLSA